MVYKVSHCHLKLNRPHLECEKCCHIYFWLSFENGGLTAVKSIKKQHLVEVRSMANPPSIVKTTLESICLLLAEGTTVPADWKTIRSVIMKENFIATIVNFNTDNITLVTPLLHLQYDAALWN